MGYAEDIVKWIMRYFKGIPANISTQALVSSKRYGTLLQSIATTVAHSMQQKNLSRAQKEDALQKIMDASSRTGLNLRAIICEADKYTGKAMFLTEGSFKFFSGLTKAPGTIMCPWFRNDTMTSGFVAKGYKMTLFDGDIGSRSVVIKHAGTYNLTWHRFNDVVSSLRIQSDTISPQQFQQVKNQRDTYWSQGQFRQRVIRKTREQANQLRNTVTNMNRTIQDQQREIRQAKALEAELGKQVNVLQERNEQLIKASSTEGIKSRIMSIENFESMNASIEKTNQFATVGLSAMIVLLVISSYSLIQN